MEIMLERVTKDKKDILFRLLQYSLFEESLNDKNTIGENALFDYPWFDAYFIEESREAYFIREQETKRLLGFAMINEHVESISRGHSIAEFLVLPKERRNQIGKKAAYLCLDKHTGSWEISPSFGSDIAYAFWQNVIAEYTKGNYLYRDGVFTII